MSEVIEGDPIRMQHGKLRVPHHPVIPFVEGDGTGPDIWTATKKVLDAAVRKALLELASQASNWICSAASAR